MEQVKGFKLINKLSNNVKEELIDFFLFLLCLTCSMFLTFRHLGGGKDGQDWSQLLQWYILWPLIILFIIFTIALGYRRYKYAKVNPFHIIVGPLFVSYLIVKLLGYVFFPIGQQTYEFIFRSESFFINYQGFDIYTRVGEYISEALIIISFYLMFNYYPSFKYLRKQIVNFSLFLPIAIATVIGLIILVCYLLGNTPLLFIPKGDFDVVLQNDALNICTHKNTYGMFMFFATMSCLILAYMNPNIIYTGLGIFYTLISMLLYSRTPFILCCILLFGIMVVCPIFHFKDKLAYCIINYCLFFLAVIAFLVLYYVFDESYLGIKIHKAFDLLVNQGTTFSRHLLAEAAMNMVSCDIFYVMFGFGKTQFYYLFNEFQIAHGGELVISAHNGWLACITTTGVFGLVFVIILNLFMLYMICYLVKVRKLDMAICYAIGFICLILYSIYEPRMLFYNDSFEDASMLLYFCYLFPLLYSYTLAKKVLVMSEAIPQKLVYPSIED